MKELPIVLSMPQTDHYKFDEPETTTIAVSPITMQLELAKLMAREQEQRVRIMIAHNPVK